MMSNVRRRTHLAHQTPGSVRRVAPELLAVVPQMVMKWWCLAIGVRKILILLDSRKIKMRESSKPASTADTTLQHYNRFEVAIMQRRGSW